MKHYRLLVQKMSSGYWVSAYLESYIPVPKLFRTFDSWDALASALTVALNFNEVNLSTLKRIVENTQRRVRIPERYALVGNEVVEKLQLRAQLGRVATHLVKRLGSRLNAFAFFALTQLTLMLRSGGETR